MGLCFGGGGKGGRGSETVWQAAALKGEKGVGVGGEKEGGKIPALKETNLGKKRNRFFPLLLSPSTFTEPKAAAPWFFRGHHKCGTSFTGYSLHE